MMISYASKVLTIRYTIHSKSNIDAWSHLLIKGPPSSARIDLVDRRNIKTPIAMRASPQKSVTAKPMLQLFLVLVQLLQLAISRVFYLRSGLYIECWAIHCMIDRGDWPRQSNAQEYVDRIAARYIANAIVRGRILFSRNDAGKCICKAS